MKRERVVRRAWKPPRSAVEVLPLDPRDPDVLRAKALEHRAIVRARDARRQT